jgi:hypothetical protein
LASGDGTVVEHSTHNPMVKGSSFIAENVAKADKNIIPTPRHLAIKTADIIAALLKTYLSI